MTKTVRLVSRTSAIFSLVFYAVVSSSAVQAKTATIVFSTWATPTEVEELNKVIFPKFEEENPGIKVKLLRTDDYVTRMISLMAAGKAPDLITVEEPMMDYFSRCGQLENLSAYIKRDKLKIGNYISIMDGRAYWESNPIGLPFHAVTSTIYYNRGLFAQAGLKDPEKAWDWNGFADMARKMTRDTNGDGKIDNWGFLLNEWECIWAPFMWANGGYLYDNRCPPGR